MNVKWNQVSLFDRCGVRLQIALAAFVVAFLCCSSAYGQVAASITGIVTDTSGAPVPSASVTAQNIETGISRSTTTNGNGRYMLPAMAVGAYEIRVSKPGFQQAIRAGVHLVIAQEADLDFQLRVSQASTQITVTEDAWTVNTSTNDISGMVGEREIKELPLNARSFDLLTALNPGVVNFTWEKTGGTGVSNSTNANDFSVEGNRPQQNIYLLNGVEFTGAAENNMQPGGVSGVLLGVEAAQEFNVLRDTYGAEYGKRPGGQVVIATQSGTNDWHGSIYEFLRNNDLDARNFFDVGNSPPPFRRNQFGVSSGGPIAKDKMFLFANYEGFRQSLDQTSATFVPAADSRSGTFVPLGSSCAVAQQAECAGVVRQMLSLWPVANGPELTLPNGAASGIAELFSSPLQTLRDDFGTARLDRVFSTRNTFTGAYTIDDSYSNTATPLDPYSTDLARLREQVLSLDDTHVFSPSLLNTARFGYSRAAYYFLGEPTPGTPAASVTSFVGSLPVGAVVVGGSTASNSPTQVGLAGSNNGTNLNVFRNIFTSEDQITWTRGKHQLRFGVWLQPFQSNEKLALSQFGQASFTSINALLGGVIGTFTYDPAPTQMNWRSFFAAWYAEDTYRIARNLTLSLGFRAESSTGWNEAHGRAATYLFTNGVINSTPHISNSALVTNHFEFIPEPRIALAWSPLGPKTVIRAGFGMYNELQDDLGYRMDQNAPFNPTYAIGGLPVSSLPEPVTPVPATAKLAPGGVQPNLMPPALISYSLRVEHQLTSNTSVTLGYVGSHGYHELIGEDTNEPAPVICPAAPCPASFPAGFGALTGMAVPAGTYYTPAPCSATVTTCNSSLVNSWSWFSEGTSSYNALQVDVNHRFSRGLSLRGTYTRSKAIDNGDSLNGTTTNNAPGLVSNPFNLRADKGPASFNARNVAVINGIYELPFGRGKVLASNWEGWPERLVSGWSVNSIITAQSGFPFTPQISYNPSRNGDTKNPVRPFLNPSFSGPVIVGKPREWFNPAAFIAPPNNSGFYGDAGRNTFYGPGLATWDFSVVKRTRIFERLNLQFRAEIFNLLNRANFNTPQVIIAVLPASGAVPIANPAAGQITNTSTTSRQVQFALKLLW
jgi:Carboxypeptidase regulatory-like domain